MITSITDEIDRRIRALLDRRTESMRRARREYSKRLRKAPVGEMLTLAQGLAGRQRWVAYELLYHHPGGISALDVEHVEELGRGIDSWQATDSFGRYVSGPAWQRERIPDDAVHRWAGSRAVHRRSAAR
jgi:hypothetical protein